MVSNIKVSIVCTAYNHEQFIAQTIDSFLEQQCDFAYEIIIHEDCSTDGTKAIIEAYEKKHTDIIKPIYQPVNIYSKGEKPWVYCFKKAKGDYIALCDGDDYWTDPLKLQKQVDFLESNLDYSGCFHNTNMIDESKPNSVLKPWRNYEAQTFTLNDTISKWALFHTSSFLFRTAALEIPKWFHKVQSADMALFTIIALKGQLYRLDESMSVYRKNINGITTNISSIDYHKNRILLFQRLRDYCKKESESFKKVIDYHKLELKSLKLQAYKTKIKSFLRL